VPLKLFVISRKYLSTMCIIFNSVMVKKKSFTLNPERSHMWIEYYIIIENFKPVDLLDLQYIFLVNNVRLSNLYLSHTNLFINCESIQFIILYPKQKSSFIHMHLCCCCCTQPDILLEHHIKNFHNEPIKLFIKLSDLISYSF
jgi:hypothetical protein